MAQVNYLIGDQFPEEVRSIVKGGKISFTLFQKAIRINAELRQQVSDLVDLRLCDYAFRVNSEIINSARDNAEQQTSEIMLKFLNGMGNYQLLKRLVRKNRIIRLLANRDIREHEEMICRLNNLRIAY